MGKLIRQFLPPRLLHQMRKVQNAYFDGYSIKSYSQEGEDMILRRLFEGRDSGFYVDVGAHHPFRFSNTYAFYKRGWHGINLDAMPGSMKPFRRFRSRDISLEAPISGDGGVMTYYVFSDAALNSFSRELSEERAKQNPKHKIIKEVKLQTYKLVDMLDLHVPNGRKIDFMNIDVEGLDLEVLQSSDWKKYRPEVVLIEVAKGPLPDIADSDISQFMNRYGYIPCAKTVRTVLFVDSCE